MLSNAEMESNRGLTCDIRVFIMRGVTLLHGGIRHEVAINAGGEMA